MGENMTESQPDFEAETTEPEIETIEPPRGTEATAESEGGENKMKVFDIGIVLGGGRSPDSEGKMTKLSIDSKLRTISAGLLVSQGMIKKLILTGGRTAGPDNPSEAELMKLYLLGKFPDLENFPILTEDSSIDTVENAKFVADLLGENYEGSLLLITNDYHMLRASKNFQRQGLKVEEMPAEDIITESSSPRYKLDGMLLPSHREEFVRNYLNSFNMKKKRAIEVGLRAMMKIDPDGTMLTKLAHILRHGKAIDSE